MACSISQLCIVAGWFSLSLVDGSSALCFVKGIRGRFVPQNQRWTVDHRCGFYWQVWHSEIIDYNDIDGDSNDIEDDDDVEEEKEDDSNDGSDDCIFVL